MFPHNTIDCNIPPLNRYRYRNRYRNRYRLPPVVLMLKVKPKAWKEGTCLPSVVLTKEGNRILPPPKKSYNSVFNAKNAFQIYPACFCRKISG